MHRGLAAEQLPQLDLYPKPAGRQRRLTVLVRLLLLIPQFIVLWLLGIVAFFAAIAAWFAALALGRLPEWAATYLSGYVAYSTRVYASLYLLVDSYPPFAFIAPESPVQIELHPGKLNRLAVFFRIILVIPAAIIASIITSGWNILAFFCWITVLVLGRTPETLFDATAAILRYSMRVQAYFLMLSSSYPKRLFGDPEAAGALPAGTAPGVTGTTGPQQVNGTQPGDQWGTPTAGPTAQPGMPGMPGGQPAGQQGAEGGLPPYTGPQEAEPQYAGAGYGGQGYGGQQYAGALAGGPEGTAGPSPTRPLLLTTGAKVLLAVFIVAGLLSGGLSGGFGSGNNGKATVTTTSPVSP